MDYIFVLQALVVLVCIGMGGRYGGVGLTLDLPLFFGCGGFIISKASRLVASRLMRLQQR